MGVFRDFDDDRYHTFGMTFTNTAPVASSVNVTPNPAYTNSNLSCNYTFTDVDLDSDVSFITWFNDTSIILTGQLNVTLQFGNFTRGDNITCQVLPSDGTDNGTAVNSSARFINNTIPEVSGVLISPTTAYSDTTPLRCNGTWTDNDSIDGQIEVSYWRWFNQTAEISVTTQTLTNTYYTYADNITCEYIPGDGTVNGTAVNSSAITISTHSINVTIIACNITQMIPTNGSQTGGEPTNQSATGCSFNITNQNDTYAADFQLLYNGSLMYYPEMLWDSFSSIWGRFDLSESTWTNTTTYNSTYDNGTSGYISQYNWTRLCFDSTVYAENYSQGLSSMRLRYFFNNTADQLREYYGVNNVTNVTEWIKINVTFGCSTTDYIRFNTTRVNYSGYEQVEIDYKLLENTSGQVSFRLNITNSDGLSNLSDYTLMDNSTTWKTLSYDLGGLNLSNISHYNIHLNGSLKGAALFDNLLLNDTDGQQRITFYGGNNTYNVSTNITTSYQTVFTIQPNETIPLKFWFDFNYPIFGINIDFSNLLYRGVN